LARLFVLHLPAGAFNIIYMNIIQAYHSASNTQKTTTWLFLSLYMLILGIFIMLVSMSTIEETKLKAAADSIKGALSFGVFDEQHIDRGGENISGARLINRINETLANDMAIATLFITQSGLTLYVNFAGDDMFVAGSASILRPRVAVLTRIAGLIKTSDENWRYEVVITVPTDYVSRNTMPEIETLAVQRAAELMRVFASRGVPLTLIKAGVRKMPTSDIQLIFRAVPYEQTGGQGDL
jgi:flagellar motor protein MotB